MEAWGEVDLVLKSCLVLRSLPLCRLRSCLSRCTPWSIYMVNTWQAGTTQDIVWPDQGCYVSLLHMYTGVHMSLHYHVGTVPQGSLFGP